MRTLQSNTNSLFGPLPAGRSALFTDSSMDGVVIVEMTRLESMNFRFTCQCLKMVSNMVGIRSLSPASHIRLNAVLKKVCIRSSYRNVLLFSLKLTRAPFTDEIRWNEGGGPFDSYVLFARAY